MERVLSPKALSYALLTLGIAATVWFVAAPTRIAREPREPRPVRLGEDRCARCRTTILDESFAAERVLEGGEKRLYDDPGCLLAEMASDRSGALFFSDFETGEWVPSARARFVPARRYTPRGFGLAAVRGDRAPSSAAGLEEAVRLVSGAVSK